MQALVLHNMGDPRGWREAVADMELAFPRYGDGIQCIVHDVAIPLPDFVKHHPFDLIIINSTVLGAVTSLGTLERLRQWYGFLANSGAYKVALPQDDYYCSNELDALVTDLKMDAVYTVCPQHWDVLYPRYLAAGGNLKLGYTGYVTPRVRGIARLTKPRDRRRFDVVYRATGRPGFPNAMAMTKATIGRAFSTRFADRGWVMDISTDDRRVIAGPAWLYFLADSRMTLGSNSGSSVLIRNLEVAEHIGRYQRQHPDADYQSIVDACVPAADRALEFTAISPRVIEAAVVENTQLLVPGPYSGVIREREHYWPLAEDCSNRDEIVELVEDRGLQHRLARACKAAVLEHRELQVERFTLAVAAAAGGGRRQPSRSFARLRARYLAGPGARTGFHYFKERIKRRTPDWAMSAYLRLKGNST